LIPMQKMAKKKLLNGTEGVQLGDRPWCKNNPRKNHQIM
jgi:hypothetical protein